jgi:hypothetical protein
VDAILLKKQHDPETGLTLIPSGDRVVSTSLAGWLPSPERESGNHF